MGLFRRSKPEPDREEPGTRRIINAWDYVPASVRTPDENRLAATVFTSLEDDDEHDEDIDFLQAIASEVEGTPLRKAAPLTGALPATPTPESRIALRDPVRQEAKADPLDLFRTVKAEELKTSVLGAMHIDDVEMDDLVEDLSTTAAALRRRRAA